MNSTEGRILEDLFFSVMIEISKHAPLPERSEGMSCDQEQVVAQHHGRPAENEHNNLR
jgi:hypothetical protein